MADNNFTSFSMDNDHFATIKVIGIGGGGCNAVNRMIRSDVKGIEFITINTDNQALQRTHSTNRLQIGEDITRGLGAGANPQVGEKAANDSRDEIARLIAGTDMLFITAGMGGGTGTGGAPVIAQIAKEIGILTVGVVTRPFKFEGSRRMINAETGIRELEKFVDSLIVVPNDKLLDIAEDDMSLDDAFNMADQVLMYGVSGISDLVAIPGLINLDLADVRKIMTNAGVCHMGIGKASGAGRASAAVLQAINSPLLDTTIDGARGVIMNFTGGKDMKLKEVDEAASVIRDAVSPDADIIFGAVIDPTLTDEIMITVIASGFDRENSSGTYRPVISDKNKTDIVEKISTVDSYDDNNEDTNKKDVPDFLSSFEDLRSTEDEEVIIEVADKKPGFLNIGDSQDSVRREAVAPNLSASAQEKTQTAFSKAFFDTKEDTAEKVTPTRPEMNTASDNQPGEKRPGRKLPWFLQDNDK